MYCHIGTSNLYWGYPPSGGCKMNAYTYVILVTGNNLPTICELIVLAKVHGGSEKIGLDVNPGSAELVLFTPNYPRRGTRWNG